MLKYKGKRHLLASILKQTQMLRLSNMLAPSSLTVFNFHRLSPDPKTTLFSEEMFGPTKQEFYDSIKFLKTIADNVTEKDLINHLYNHSPLPKRGFMITFDDGYLDNYKLAMPVLCELKTEGIFFIPTEVIEQKSIAWWDQIAYFLKKTKKNKITINGRNFDLNLPRQINESEIILMMKNLTADKTKNLLHELSKQCDVALPTENECAQDMMTWPQIKEMSEKSMVIGSHTHTHRVLSTLNLNSQREELTLSKKIIEERIGKKINSFAYPVGGYEHFNIETEQLIRDTGYQIAFSFLTGVNYTKNTMNAADIRRVDCELDSVRYEAVVSIPTIFGKRKCALDAPKKGFN